MFPIRKILHPTDFSEAAKHAFDVACSLARDQGAHLLVAHVVQTGVGIPLPETFSQQPWKQLLQIQDSTAKVHVEHLLREGDPTAEIPHLAEELKCDLIVMGTQSWARGDRLLMGSVAHAVFSKACVCC